jgi:predicted nucleic acid-binding protein
MREHDFDLRAPHLLDVEVLERYPHDGLAPRMWALRANFSAYDAPYVALASTRICACCWLSDNPFQRSGARRQR